MLVTAVLLIALDKNDLIVSQNVQELTPPITNGNTSVEGATL